MLQIKNKFNKKLENIVVLKYIIKYPSSHHPTGTCDFFEYASFRNTPACHSHTASCTLRPRKTCVICRRWCQRQQRIHTTKSNESIFCLSAFDLYPFSLCACARQILRAPSKMFQSLRVQSACTLVRVYPACTVLFAI